MMDFYALPCVCIRNVSQQCACALCSGLGRNLRQHAASALRVACLLLIPSAVLRCASNCAGSSSESSVDSPTRKGNGAFEDGLLGQGHGELEHDAEAAAGDSEVAPQGAVAAAAPAADHQGAGGAAAPTVSFKRAGGLRANTLQAAQLASAHAADAAARAGAPGDATAEPLATSTSFLPMPESGTATEGLKPMSPSRAHSMAHALDSLIGQPLSDDFDGAAVAFAMVADGQDTAHSSAANAAAEQQAAPFAVAKGDAVPPAAPAEAAVPGEEANDAAAQLAGYIAAAEGEVVPPAAPAKAAAPKLAAEQQVLLLVELVAAAEGAAVPATAEAAAQEQISNAAGAQGLAGAINVLDKMLDCSAAKMTNNLDQYEAAPEKHGTTMAGLLDAGLHLPGSEQEHQDSVDDTMQ